MQRLIPPSFCLAALLAAGCSAVKPPATAPPPIPSAEPAIAPKAAPIYTTELEGSWQGVELTPDQEGLASINFTGNTLEFHGDDDWDWAKGTFALHTDKTPKQLIGTITECPDPAGLGKSSCSIYKIEAGSLTLAGSAPGDSNPPANFNDAARIFVFERVQ
jgi:uncharacterized protein (TIGR03067 family)